MVARETGDREAVRLSRRTLLQRALSAAALGVLGIACQAPAPRAAPPSPSGAPAPPAGGPATAPTPSVALARRHSVKIAWTAITCAQSGVWMAYETGAWQELGLDVELVRLGSSTQMAASLRAGEIDGGVLDWALAFQFVAQGGNARQVAAITNRQPFSVISVPSITRPQEVVGKRWGITRIGSAIHTASLLALEQWGLRPEDVQFLALQEVPAILAAMQAGQIDVGVMSPPTNTRAIQAGFRELLDLAEAGPEFPSVAMAILDRHIEEQPDLVRAYVAGYSLGVARFRRDRERALEVLRKYLQLDDEAILVDTHARFSRYLAFPPRLPMASLPRVKESVVQEDPRVANVAISDVADPRFVEELEAMGFFANLL